MPLLIKILFSGILIGIIINYIDNDDTTDNKKDDDILILI